MGGSSPDAELSAPSGDPYAVRPARQVRSRLVWGRVLDAGLRLVEDVGYDGFTIAAVCERADVAPQQIYARVDSKEALFLAVYEHGIARLEVVQGVLEDERRWVGRDCREVVEGAVRAVADVFAAGQGFLRAVIVVAGTNPEIRRRGNRYNLEFAERFVGLVLRSDHGQIARRDRRTAVVTAYNAVWSSLVMRTAFGPGFAAPPMDDEDFVDGLVGLAAGYLFTPLSTP